MLLALGISNVDLVQAQRLIRWIGFLSERDGRSMLEKHCLIVFSLAATKYPQAEDIVRTARISFRSVHTIVPPEHEVGWPGAANWMFLKALEHIEETEYTAFQDAMLWMEPDASPLSPSWFRTIESDYAITMQSGKPFMGAFVPEPPHLTGISVYPRNWRQLVPKLAKVPDAMPWDTYCGSEILPHATLTTLIQHVFKRHEKGWRFRSLADIDPRAVIYHQDKHGILIPLLDQKLFEGACARHPLFTYESTYQESRVMTKFYKIANATKALRVHNKRFVFDPVQVAGGAMPGVFATDIEADQIALDEAAADPRLGLSEITQEQWERAAKKKFPSGNPNSPTSKPSNVTSPGAALLPTPSKKAAVVVGEPLPRTSEIPGLTKPLKDITEVLKIDSVVPSQPLPPVPTQQKRGTRKGE